MLAGTVVGPFQGLVMEFFGIPSFVVTVEGLLAWKGFQLRVLGGTGTAMIAAVGSAELGRGVPLAGLYPGRRADPLRPGA